VAGYSGTPLARKLGIKEGAKVVAIDAPKGYSALLEPLPAAVQFSSNVDKTADIVHVFSTKKAELSRALAGYRKVLDSSAAVWVSWPKKSAKVPTDITEDVVRELALPLRQYLGQRCNFGFGWCHVDFLQKAQRFCIQIAKDLSLETIGDHCKQQMARQGSRWLSSEYGLPTDANRSEVEIAQMRDLDVDLLSV